MSNQWDYDRRTYWQIWNLITIIAGVINSNQPHPQPFCLFRKFEMHRLWCLEPARTSCGSSSSPSPGACISGGPREEAQGYLEIREPFANTLCLWSFNSKPKYQRCCDWGNSLKLSIEEAKSFQGSWEKPLRPASHLCPRLTWEAVLGATPPPCVIGTPRAQSLPSQILGEGRGGESSVIGWGGKGPKT